MKVGFVIPFKKEAKETIRGLGLQPFDQENFNCYSGSFSSLELTLILSGGGKILSASATQFLIDKFNPDIIIHSGAGGRINEKLNIFDVVWGKYILEYDIFEGIDYSKSKFKPITCNHTEFFNLTNQFLIFQDHIIGTILSADRDIVTEDDRVELYRRFLGDSCDWESIGIAKVADRNKIPYIIFRVISDLADKSAADDFYNNLPKVSERIWNINKKILEFLLKNH